MIPKHLDGIKGIDIIKAVKDRHIHRISSYDDESYIKELEVLLLLAIEDALLNAEEIKELIVEGEYKAMTRAITFLNGVLPEKKQKEGDN